MTVAELIAALQKMPQEAVAFVSVATFDSQLGKTWTSAIASRVLNANSYVMIES